MATEIGGIEGVLSDFMPKPSPSPKRSIRKPKKAENASVAGSSTAIEDATDSSVPASPRQIKVRTGRPLGRKNQQRVLRQKATLWLSAELMAQYRDWSWEERCHLGELIDRALAEYIKKRRATSDHDGG